MNTPIPFDLAVVNEGNSSHRDQEYIFSRSRDWRVFQLLHRLFRLEFLFIWTGVKSGRVWLTRETPLMVKEIRWLSSRRWTWKKETKFGTLGGDCFSVRRGEGGIWLTAVTTTIISRVSCWRRKLWPHFDDLFWLPEKLLLIIIEKIIYVWGNGIKYKRIKSS
jgi:hypothetical protein